MLYRFADSRRGEILQWLCPTIPSVNFEEALEKRLKETGVWFLTSAEYLAWKSAGDSLLWMYGKRMSANMISNDS